MIPIQLTLEGLYSYQEKQIIDFEKLTAAGLFGIFGETGSGKSSVLEAITYTLYGEIERMNKRDNAAYNMLNLKSNRANLEFVFLNHENKKFKVNRGLRRNSKNFMQVNPVLPIFYEEINAEWQPVEKNAEQILGLSYNNFKRTIIIPQGQFREFIELRDRDRSIMMEEIFQLERFDLQGKTKTLNTENIRLLNLLEGKLGSYNEVSAENIREKKESLKIAEEEQVKIQEKFNKTTENYQNLKKTKADFELLANKKEEFRLLSVREKEFEQLQLEINRFEKIEKIFAPLFENQRKYKAEIHSIRQSLEKAVKSKENIEKQLLDCKKEREKMEAYFEQLPIKREEENDLLFLHKILTTQNKITQLTQKKQEAKAKEEAKKILQQENIQTISVLENEVKLLKNNIIDSNLMLDVATWFHNLKNLEENLQLVQNKIEQFKNALAEENDRIRQKGLSPTNYVSHFEQETEKIKAQKELLDKSRKELELQQKLAEYADALHDGIACPLCGSENHPEIAQAQNVSTQLFAVLLEIKNADNKISEINKSANEVEKMITKLTLLKQQLKEEELNKKKLDTEWKTHFEAFQWEGFDKKNRADFEEKKKQSEENNNLLKKKEKELEKARKEQVEIATVFEKIKEETQQIILQENEFTTEIKSNEGNLKHLKLIDFKFILPEEIQQKHAALKSKNNTVEAEHKKITQLMHDLTPKLEATKATLEAFQAQQKELDKKWEEINEKITNSSNSMEISVDFIQNSLENPIDISAKRKEIENFKIHFGTLRNVVSELETKLENNHFELEYFKKVEAEHQKTAEELETKKEVFIRLKSDIERLEIAFKEKQTLLLEQEKLKNRGENLSKMMNLFSARGFVNFISSIHLQQLCEYANVRFHRMTRNRLSLRINEKNEFEIIDCLNEGKTRSVKTLSGGQSFQVSLSLALALAESVQAKSKTEQHFFFIDEGFGTQDKEAVNIVFETLLNLNKENKIVGIISHVEELKERIPASLTIIKDEHTGSKVFENQ